MWLDGVRDLLGDLDAMADGLVGTRNALFAVWLAIDRAPSQIRDVFRSLDEAELDTAATSLDFGKLAFDVGRDTSRGELRAVLRNLTLRLRALEKRLLHIAPASTTRDPGSLVATYGADEAYVILREARNKHPRLLQPFSARALVATRLIPTRLGDFKIRLHLSEDFLGRTRVREGAALRLGAALFEGLEVEEETSGEGCVVIDARAPGQIDTIRRQIAAATEASCSIVVFPELSISTATLQALQRGLATEWRPAGCSLTVAGSRHHLEADGRRFNVATVLDAYGQLVAEHRKLFPYLAGKDSDEAIEPGHEIQVIVTEEAIYALALCLDFCLRTEDTPYTRLDVDYVIVPSLGNRTTIESHILRSGDAILKAGTRAGVVQQTYGGTETDPLGYAFVRSSRDALTPEEVEMRTDWHTLDL